MSPKQRKIMVVEDERLVAEDIAECLRARDFDVCGIAKSCEEAVAIAREHLPELVLMDIVIQGEKDGIETAKVLRDEFHVPAVFLTAYSQEGIVERAKEVNPLGYVVKPFEEGSLVSTVEIALHKSRLDEELRKSEEWFSTTLNSIGDGVIATDADGKVRYLNRLAEGLTGWNLDEARGRPIDEVFRIENESTRARVMNPALEALETGEIRELANHTVLMRPDGSEIPIEDSGAPIRNPEGRIVGSVLVFRDVTEKKRREEEVAGYQSHLEELVAERTSALERRVKLERMVIELSAELIRLNEDTYEEGLHYALSQIAAMLELDGCGIYETFEEKGVRKTRRVSVWTSKPEILDRLKGNLPGDDQLSFWSEQLERHGKVVIRSREEIPESAVVEGGLMDLLEIQSLALLPLGLAKPVRWTISFSSQQPQDWNDDDFVMFQMLASILKSVLERRELEGEQRSLQEQLNQSQKLEAIGKLSGGIAHDFNNMLVPIIGYADVIMKEEDPDDVCGEIIEIRRAAESAASLTRQLLAFSRKQILDTEPLSVNDLVTNMERMLKRLLGEDIQFELDLDPDVLEVEADRGQMEQVLMNLCVNARDAMPHGGRLSIRSLPGSSPKDGTPSVIIQVEDSGCGIDPEVVDNIFDPFFTTKGMDGTGLGLSVVVGVMQQHKGWVSVDSEKGEGTKFTIGLPAHTRPASAPKPIREEVPNQRCTRGVGQRILLVEDEPAVVQFVSKALQAHGYEVVFATTRTSACEVYDREEGHFDMVFTDAMLPDGNGIEVLEHVHSHNPDMPVLLSSGYTDDRALVNKARKIGGEFLQKPYSLDRLYDTVHGVLNGNPESDTASQSGDAVALVR